MPIDDVVRACKAAGFTGGPLVRMVAIAGAESGWSNAATNDTRRFSQRDDAGLWYDPDTGERLPIGIWPEFSVGAFQINLLVHGELITPEDARDYEKSAEYAMRLYQEAEFDRWSTNATLNDWYLREAAMAVQRDDDRPAESAREGDRLYLEGSRARALLVELASLVTRGDECYVEGGGESGFVRVVTAVPNAYALEGSAVLRSLLG